MNFRVTDMYTDEKRDEKTLVPDGKGRLVDQDEYPESGDFIYSVGEDGKMVVGEEGAWELREVDTGRVIDTFVTRREAEERAKNSGAGCRSPRRTTRRWSRAKTSAAPERSKSSAARSPRSRTSRATTCRGSSTCCRRLKSLLQSGVILNKELVDYQGRKAEDISPDVKKVFKAVQPRLAELPKDKAR